MGLRGKAMSTETEYNDTVTADKIRALLGSGMKSIYIRDGNGRIEVSYEASVHIEIGAPCLRTKHKYADGALGNSRKVIAYEEQVVAWPGYEILEVGAANDIDLVS